MMKMKKQAETSDIAAIAAVIVALCGLFLMISAPAENEQPQAVTGVDTVLTGRTEVVLASFNKASVAPFSPVSRKALLPVAKGYAQELTCLTQAIYYEARSEAYSGRVGVAEVVLNRVSNRHYPASICGVVFQGPQDKHKKGGCQFSFTCDGSLAVLPRGKPWDDAGRLAAQVMLGFDRDVTNDATHYHADYVDPFWAGRLKRTVQIGRHIFYRFAS